MAKDSESLTRKDIVLIIVNAFVAIVAGVIAVVIAGEGRFLNFTPDQVVALALSLAFLLIAVIVLIVKWKSVLRLLTMLPRLAGITYRWLKRWMKANLQPLIGLLILSGVTYVACVLTHSLWIIGLTVGLSGAIILLTRSIQRTFQRPSERPRFHTVQLPSTVTNANLEARYMAPPQGEVNLGGVEFLVREALYDSESVRYIEPDGRSETKLELPEPVERVKSAHLLINASGGWRIHEESNTVLEWRQIGRIRLNFEGGTFQDTELILGDNIREWAIGNFPGRLVGRSADPLCQVVWKGKTASGNYAVIDKLEIPVLESNRKKRLKSLSFIRDIPHGAEASEGGLLHFLVSGVTLELDDSAEKTGS